MPSLKLPLWANLNTLAAVIIAALCVYIGIQKIELLTCRLHNKDYQAQLEKISDARNEQKQTTQGKLVEARIIYRDASKAAERIEKAPTAPECRTPDAIMGADL